MHTSLFFDIGNVQEFMNQLSVGNRLIFKDNLKGFLGFSFKCRYFYEKGTYYIWLTNDERRKLLVLLNKLIPIRN